mgnify:CR=1 FL=1
MARIITIDGPAGTGKSTVSRGVADRLEMPHLDTGAYYRAATLLALREGVDIADGSSLARLVRSVFLDQVDGRMLVDGEDVSVEIRTPPVNGAVSEVSAHPEVREALVEQQRAWVELHGGAAVVEGRDIGSVVFPNASLKIYLDARPEERARRRALQTGEPTEAVLADQERRDGFDSSRALSPLSVPPGAHVIDTSDLSLGQVVERILGLAGPDSAG